MPPTIPDGPSTISETLNRLHYGRGISNERLARLAGVAPSTMTRARGDELDLRAGQLQALALALCAEGITDLAEALLTPAYAVTPRATSAPDGCLSDEARDLTKAFGRVLDCFEAGDLPAARDALALARKALDDTHAELDAR